MPGRGDTTATPDWLLVHYRSDRSVKVAPCGYKFRPRARGTDASDHFSRELGGHPVDCQLCIDWKVDQPATRTRRPPKRLPPINYDRNSWSRLGQKKVRPY